MRLPTLLLCLLFWGLPAFSACGATGRNSAPAQETAAGQSFVTRVITDRLAMPWSFAFLPDGHILVTEHAGKLRRLDPLSGSFTDITNVPEVYHQGLGGLLDVALHPDYTQQRWIYLSYAAPVAQGKSATRLARALLEGDSLQRLEVLYSAEPAVHGRMYFGGRLLIDGGYLYLTVGERGERYLAQRLDNDLGKVLRLHLDGSVPTDNPFAGRPGARPAILTLGHRNPQGLARHPASGDIWITEHGPRGGDELNRLVAGANYGWPVITYGEEYRGGKIGEGTAKAGMEQPVYYYVPSIATGGLAFYHGDKFPYWRNAAFITALAGMHLNLLLFGADGKITEHRLLASRQLRLRDVKVGPDGYLYLLAEQGSLLRLEPAQ